MGEIKEGDTVVVFGAGPVGIFAAKSAWLLGAGRVIVVDHIEYRLQFVQGFAQCEIIDFREVRDMAIPIKKITDGLGADVCIDAVGCEAAKATPLLAMNGSRARYFLLESAPVPRYRLPMI